MSRVVRLRLQWERKLPDRIAELRTLYRTIDLETDRFARARGVTCPPGCGSCCERFIPDCSDSEAEYAARFVLFSGIDPSPLHEIDGACPLYDPTSDAHCRIYPARPFVCRLFGYSGARDKQGERRFRPCRLAIVRPPEASTPGERGAESAEIPMMSDFATSFSASDQRGSFPVLLSGQLGRLLLIRELKRSALTRFTPPTEPDLDDDNRPSGGAGTALPA
jgi:uncharacterized protein